MQDRDENRQLHVQSGIPFLEVFISAPLEVCEQRDVKGLYKKARAGEIKDFTGVSSAYEVPTNPELVLCTDKLSVQESVQQCIELLAHSVSSYCHNTFQLQQFFF